MGFLRAAIVQSADVGPARSGGRVQTACADAAALGRGRLALWRAVLASVMAVALAAGLYATLGGGHQVAPPSGAHGARSHAFAQQSLLSLPQAARGPVSAALGADSRAYWMRTRAGGFSAANPAQRLTSAFSDSGVSVTAGATRLALRVRGLGFGASLAPLAAVSPRAHGNSVIYRRSGLSERYANGPIGLEQGFTIARSRAAQASGPLTLALTLSGNARPSLANDGQSIAFIRAGKTVLRYEGLTATDAHRRLLHSWLALQRGRLLLRVDARGASYPLRIDPFIQQAKLTVSGEIGNAFFGSSVALSSDGSTALVGGPVDNNGVGAAWVFTREGTAWSQQAKLAGSEEVGEGGFGRSVALSSDGSTALVGGRGDNSGVGAAWVFTREGTSWQQGSKLTGAEELGQAHFGDSVALSGDGSTALIGGPDNNSSIGAAWVFTHEGTAWSQQAKLTGAEELGQAHFGDSVALSSDGSTALIGGRSDDSGVGAAWAFTREGTAWSQQAKLTGSEETGQAYFGESVALSADGNTALIGGPDDNTGVGAAWAFTREGPAWSQQGQKLIGSEEIGAAFFGHSVTLSSDGSTALIGGPDDHNGIGAAWALTREGTIWSHQGLKLTDTEHISQNGFGRSVALSANASTALIGGVGEPEDIKLPPGAAWVFVRLAPGEYGQCLKRAGGRYKNSGCTVNAPSGEENYEWYPGNGSPSPKTGESRSLSKLRFTSEIKPETIASLEGVRGTRITCTGETAHGEYVMPNRVKDLVATFSACESAGSKCESAGQSEGVVVSAALEGVTGVVKKGETEAKDGLGLDLVGIGGFGDGHISPLAEFSCGGVPVVVRGSVIHVVPSAKMTLQVTEKFAQKEGKQKPELLLGEAKDVLLQSVSEAEAEQSGLALTTITKSEQKIELNPLF